jgi:formylglycine-generating enzyme required for sulfatase activity/serine/threonine protein kinase
MATPPSSDPAARPTAAADTGSAPATPAPGGPAGSLSLAPGIRPVPEYELVAFLGGGGFGEVWKAKGPGGIHVALKFIRLDRPRSAVEQRALELLKEVRHPNLLDVYGAWQSGNLLILAMQLGDKTLLHRLEEARQAGQEGIPRAELLDHLRDAARGLDHLNGLGIQHRDVKPHNLLLIGGGVKVADFGLAKLLEQTVASNSGAMTMAYAAPECFDGRVSDRSDQYSLGVTYCQLRGGRLPFVVTAQQLMAGHVEGTPDLTMLPQVERPLVRRALAKKPEERWPSCRAFAEALAAADQGSATAPVPVPAPPGEALRVICPGCGQMMEVPPVGQSRTNLRCPGCQLIFEFRLPSDHGTVPGPARPGSPRPLLRRLFTAWLLVPLIGGCVIVPVAVISAIIGQKGPTPPTTSNLTPKTPVWPGPDPGKRPQMKMPLPPGAPPAPAPKDPPPPAPDGREMVNSIGMKLVRIPAGKFLMGSPANEEGRYPDEGPQHEVEITQPFYMGAYEVTQEEYQKVMGTNPSWFSAEGRGKDRVANQDTRRFPVESVSWSDATEFCRRLSELPEEKRSRRAYRLPTEAEWEYACRGGAPSSEPFHLGKTLTTDQANIDRKLGRTTAVGSYPANAFGLYDMHGNVCEWCRDGKRDYRGTPVRDPQGPENESARAVRGGSWYVEPRSARSASRHAYTSSYRANLDVGFRVVLPLGGKTP